MTAWATSRGRQRGSSCGSRRAARSHTRSFPSRPTIVIWPPNQRMSSMRPRPFPSFQPPVRHGTVERSSRSRDSSGPRRRSSAST